MRPSTGATLMIAGGIAGIGFGFWRMRPGIIFAGAGIVLGGYLLGGIR